MGELPTPEGGADNGDAGGAAGDSPTPDRGYIHYQLRAGTLARDAVATGEVAVPYCHRGRVLPIERVSTEQGDGQIFSAGGYCTVHWEVVEPDWDAGPEWAAGSVGADVLHRLRRAIEEELHRVCRGVPYGEPVHAENCPTERGGGVNTGGGEGCPGCL